MDLVVKEMLRNNGFNFGFFLFFVIFLIDFIVCFRIGVILFYLIIVIGLSEVMMLDLDG